MTVGTVIFGMILLAVILVELIVYGITRFTKTDGRIRDDYDERQQLVRGRGYRAGFFAMMLAMAAYGLSVDEVDFPADHAVMVFLIIFFGVMVYAVYCIWGYAYFPVNGRKMRILLVLLPAGLLNISQGIGAIRSGEAFTEGKLNFHSVPLFAGGMFIAVFLAAALRRLADRREERLER